jgi:hypothetical protein
MDCSPIQIRVENFLPYFYLLPSAEIKSLELKNFINKNFTKAECLGVEAVKKQSIYGYSRCLVHLMSKILRLKEDLYLICFI